MNPRRATWAPLWAVLAVCGGACDPAPTRGAATAGPDAIDQDTAQASVDGVPYERQPHGPGCVAAAVSMVLRFHGAETDATQVMRAVPVWPDGIALFDVSELVREHGLTGQVFNASMQDLEVLLQAGLPVVAIVASSPGSRARHAVVVTGVTASTVRRLDPAVPTIREEPRAQFEAAFAAAGGAALLIARPEQLATPGLAARASRIAEENRRFRAIELARRAEEHGDPNPQKAALYRRAIAEDPGLAALHNNLAVTLAALGQTDEAHAALRRAIEVDPDFALARQNLQKLEQGRLPDATLEPTPER